MDINAKIVWLIDNYKSYDYNWYLNDIKRTEAIFRREYLKWLGIQNDIILTNLFDEKQREIRDMSIVYNIYYGTYFDEDMKIDKKGTAKKVIELYSFKERWNELMLIGYHAYVDGSYNTSTYEYGSGIVVILNDEIIHEKSLSGNNPDTSNLRNVTGELRAAMYAVEFAQRSGAKQITIHYDYTGIENWVTESWKRNNDFTKKYNEFMKKKISEGINIVFRKVKAHSNDKLNDRADELAKQGCNKL